MSIMKCDCDKPTPKHINGVFCTTCKGFIETNNDARTEALKKPKESFKWHEQKKPVQVPIQNGDVVLVDIKAKAVMLWSTEIVADVDEDDVPEYTSGWVMEIPAQKVVYKDQNFIHVASATTEKPSPKDFHLLTTYEIGSEVVFHDELFVFDPSETQAQFSLAIFPSSGYGWVAIAKRTTEDEKE